MIIENTKYGLKSALTVSRKGAASSIPTRNEVEILSQG